MPPGTRNALVPPSPNYLASAGQLVGGVGRGLSNQFVTSPLQLVQQSYEDPYSLGQGIYEGARSLMADPVGVVGNSLRGMWNRAKSGPAGLGEVIGENIDPRNWLKPRKALRKELDVYHGTPHTFPAEEGAPLGRFRSEKIGTGEGAQAYGYGLYFAEDPSVAKDYQQKLSGASRVLPVVTQYGDIDSAIAETEKRILHFRNAVARSMANPSSSPAMLEINRKSLEGAERGLQDLKDLKAGNLGNQGSRYKVDLPDAKIEQMLDWDKPLAEQPKSVRDALLSNPAIAAEVQRINEQRVRLNEQNPARLSRPVVGKLASKETTIDSLKGHAIYELLAKGGNQAQASEYLRSLGIPGIKFLDQGSRAAGQGTRNFVVFPGEEQHLNILSRD